MDVHAGALMASAHLVHRDNTGGGQPPPPPVTSVRHAGDVAVLQQISQAHISVKEGGGAEATKFGGGGRNDGDLKGIQSLWAHP